MSIFIGILILIVLLQYVITNNEMVLIYSVLATATIGLLYILFKTYILYEDDYSELIIPLSIFVGIVFLLKSIFDYIEMEAWKKRFEEDGYRDNQKDIDSFLTKTILKCNNGLEKNNIKGDDDERQKKIWI